MDLDRFNEGARWAVDPPFHSHRLSGEEDPLSIATLYSSPGVADGMNVLLLVLGYRAIGGEIRYFTDFRDGLCHVAGTQGKFCTQ
jgi:hypothetical protein